MFTKIKTLIFIFFGIFLTTSLQCMEIERSVSDGLLHEPNSLHISLGHKDATLTPKSYRMLDLMVQHKFYQYCEPDETKEGQRAFEESTANLAYSKTPSAQKSISPQPEREQLKNQVDIEIEESCKKKEKRIADLKATLALLESWQNTEPSWMYPQDRIERHTKAEELTYHSLRCQFLHEHGFRDVMLGKRTPSEQDIKVIELKIHEKIPVQIIITPRGFRSPAIGTPYLSFKPELHEGFTLPAYELKRHCEELNRRIQSLQREYDIMSDVWLMYSKQFLPKVEGWLQLGNWVSIKPRAKEFRQEVKKTIEEKYPQSADPTDRDLILAELKQGRKFKHFKSLIRKVPSEDPQQVTASSSDLFPRVYLGQDVYEISREACSIETKYPATKPLAIVFQTARARRFVHDEERYQVQVMWKNPPEPSLTKLGTNKIGLHLRNDLLSWKVHEQSEGKLLADDWDLVADDRDLAKRLRAAVENNRNPNPEDRRQLLDFLFNNQYIFRRTEVYTLPKGAQMVTAFPSLAYVMEHRKAWNEVGGIDQIRNPPKLKPHNPNGEDYTEKYNRLYQAYQTLFTNYIKLLMDMYQPYSTGKTRIPRGWKFFIAETYEKPSGVKTVPQQIDLSKAALCDDDLDNNEICDLLLPFQAVNLSQNFLTGMGAYRFTNLTTLNVSQNQISCLDFLSGLNALLTLNLSHNKVRDVKPLSALVTLERLDISDNEIESLSDLSPANLVQTDAQTPVKKSALVSLKASKNKLAGPWTKVLPTGLDCLTELDLKENPKLNVLAITGNHIACFLPKNFQEYFPSLKTIRTDRGDVEDLAAENFVINLENNSLDDSCLAINSQRQLLTLQTKREKDITEHSYSLVIFTDLRLSHNLITGQDIPLSKFCSNRIARVQIAHNKLTNIGFLAGLTIMTDLDVSNNAITNLDPLSTCSFLVNLDMSDNKVETLVPLANCKNLKTLKANRNKLYNLNDSVFPMGLDQLETLEISGNTYIDGLPQTGYKNFFPGLVTLSTRFSEKKSQLSQSQGDREGSRG